METTQILGICIWVILLITTFSTMIYFAYLAQNWAKQDPEGTDLSKYHFIAIGCCWLSVCIFGVGFAIFWMDINIMEHIAFFVSLYISMLVFFIGGIIVNLRIHS